MSAPSMTVNWLPPSRVYDTTPQYPQVHLAPSQSGLLNSPDNSVYRISDDSRRNLAGLARLAGARGFGTLDTVSPAMYTALGVLSLVSSGASAFHGYRRHRGSIGWAVAWGALGAFFPIITPAVALAQGYGKPMKGK